MYSKDVTLLFILSVRNKLWKWVVMYLCVMDIGSAGFTYRLDRLKPRASEFRGTPAKVYNIFNTVIGLSRAHLCCHNVLYFLNNSYSIALHFRLLQNFKHPSSSSTLLKLIKHTSMFLQSRRWGNGRGLTSGIT